MRAARRGVDVFGRGAQRGTAAAQPGVLLLRRQQPLASVSAADGGGSRGGRDNNNNNNNRRRGGFTVSRNNNNNNNSSNGSSGRSQAGDWRGGSGGRVRNMNRNNRLTNDSGMAASDAASGSGKGAQALGFKFGRSRGPEEAAGAEGGAPTVSSGSTASKLQGMISLQEKIGEVGKRFRARRQQESGGQGRRGDDRDRDAAGARSLSRAGADADVDIDDLREEWTNVARQNDQRQMQWALGRVYFEMLEEEWAGAKAHRKQRHKEFKARSRGKRRKARTDHRTKVLAQDIASGRIPLLAPNERALYDGNGVFFADALSEEIGARPQAAPAAALQDDAILDVVFGGDSGAAKDDLRATGLDEDAYRQMVRLAHRAERLQRSLSVTDPMEVPVTGLEGAIHNFTRVVHNNPTFTIREKRSLVHRFKRDVAKGMGREPAGHNEQHGYQPSL